MEQEIKSLIESVKRDVRLIQERSPLVHNITNYVVMNNTANALLSIGASPVMAHSVDEVEDMVSIASALVINIGTLSKDWVKAMLKAGSKAYSLGVPIVLDPVGAGATSYRTEVCREIIETCHPSIIRGNASEIMALAGTICKTKGVDSTTSSDSAIDSAKVLANAYKTIVSISGEVDYITDGREVVEVFGGSAIMPKVTGMGCTASAITGAFAAVNSDYMSAAANAMQMMSWAGEMAAEVSDGPGSFQVNFIDTLYKIALEL